MRSQLELIRLLASTGSNPNQILVKLGLRQALLGCKSVLDVGSGVALTLRELGVEHAVGAEGYLPSLEIAKSQKTTMSMCSATSARSGSISRPDSLTPALPWM